jgi:hypothetical protein
LTTHLDPFSTRAIVVARSGKDPALSVVVHADVPIVAEYTAYLDKPAGITGALGIFAPSRKWYAAEGYKSSTFGDYLALYNPDQQFKAQVTVQLFKSPPALRGSPVPYATATLFVPPDSRGTFDLGAIAPRGAFTMLLTSTVRIAVNRIETFGPGRSRVAMVNAVQKTSASWLFPSGDTSSEELFAGKQVITSFREYLTIFNPFATRSSSVTVVTTNPAGTVLRQSHVTLPPYARATFDMFALLGQGRHVTTVSATNGAQVVAEQTIYFDGQWGGASAPGIQLP